MAIRHGCQAGGLAGGELAQAGDTLRGALDVDPADDPVAGAPKTAITASPTNFSTNPSNRAISADIAWNRSFWNARTSSGSTRSLSAVKPERSAKSTVTGRRSASAPGAADLAAGPRGADTGSAGRAAVNADPHLGQNAKSGAHAKLHEGQTIPGERTSSPKTGQRPGVSVFERSRAFAYTRGGAIPGPSNGGAG